MTIEIIESFIVIVLKVKYGKEMENEGHSKKQYEDKREIMDK